MEATSNGKPIKSNLVIILAGVICFGIATFLLCWLIFKLSPRGEGWVTIYGDVISTSQNPPRTVVRFMIEGQAVEHTFSEYNIEFLFNKHIRCAYNTITGQIITDLVSTKVFFGIGIGAFGLAGVAIIVGTIKDALFVKNYVKPEFTAEKAYMTNFNLNTSEITTKEPKDFVSYVIKRKAGTRYQVSMFDSNNTLIYESKKGVDQNNKKGILYTNLITKNQILHTFKAKRILQNNAQEKRYPSRYYFLLNNVSCFDYLESVGIFLTTKSQFEFEVYYLNKLVGIIRRNPTPDSVTRMSDLYFFKVECDPSFIDVVFFCGGILHYLTAMQMLFH